MPQPVERFVAKFLCHVLETILSFGRWLLFIGHLIATSLRSGIMHMLPLIVGSYRSTMLVRRFATERAHRLWDDMINEQRMSPIIAVTGAMAIMFIGINVFMPTTSYEQTGHSSILYNLVGQQSMDQDSSIDTDVADGEEDTTTIPSDDHTKTPSSTTIVDGSSMMRPLILEPTGGRKTIRPYVVEDGDTISSIAAKFGLRLETLLWQNKLTAYTLIRPGQTLSILPVDGVTHTVSKGDTLALIAKRYKADVNAVMAFNNIKMDKALVRGQTLVIPEGSPVAVARPHAIAVAKTKHKELASILLPPSAGISLENIGSFLWPTVSRHINQFFHWHHPGVDIKGTLGSPVYAADAGFIEVAGWNNGGYGYQVIINHGDGKLTRYAHLSRFLVARGQYVEKGETIGLVGSTGHSTGPHLHFEIIANGKRMNPLSLLNK